MMPIRTKPRAPSPSLTTTTMPSEPMVTIDTTKKAFGAARAFIQPRGKSLRDRAGEAGEKLWSGIKGTRERIWNGLKRLFG